MRRAGNLPFDANSGVHAADDVVLTAMGPGAEQFRGRIDNTRVFRAMATALGLGDRFRHSDGKRDAEPTRLRGYGSSAAPVAARLAAARCARGGAAARRRSRSPSTQLYKSFGVRG